MGKESAPSPWTHNVIYGLASGGLYCLGYGLFSGTVLPSLISVVGGDKMAVGYAEGLQGIATLITAFPAGYLADKWSRSLCIKLGVCIAVLSGVCTGVAVLIAEPKSPHAYTLMCLALCLEGVVDGIMAGPCVALMNDSTPSGKRSDVETFNTVMYEIAGAAGPLLGMVVLYIKGDNWTLDSMKAVILFGLVIALSANVPAWLMDDGKALGEASEAAHLQVGGEGNGNRECMKGTVSGCRGWVDQSKVVYVMFASDLILGLGAGMTVKFFPIFFKEETRLRPASLQATMGALSVLMIFGTLGAHKAAKRFGRIQVILPSISISILCTFLIGNLTMFYTNAFVMVPLFMIRCMLAWSIGALQGSIVADYTPKSTRARWKALNSVSGMGFSGSAAAGGWIIDNYGFGACFTVTAMLQLMSIPLFCSLLQVVAKESDLMEVGAWHHGAKIEADERGMHLLAREESARSFIASPMSSLASPRPGGSLRRIPSTTFRRQG